MTFGKISALTALTGFALGLVLALPGTADAQTTRKRVQQPPKYIYYGTQERMVRTANGRRIFVQQRSFLSGGPESLQRDQHYTDYSHPPGYTGIIDRNDPKVSFNRMPLADPWDIPGWPKF
jgi:hypothetical protein